MMAKRSEQSSVAPVAYSDRLAALTRERSRIEAVRVAEHARLDRAESAAHVAAEAALAELQRDHEAVLPVINARIAASFHTAAVPALQAFFAEPSRAALAPLVPAVDAVEAAAQHELGGEFPLGDSLLAAAKRTLIAARPECAGSLAPATSPAVADGAGLEAAHHAGKALLAGDVGAAVERLKVLESVLLRQSRGLSQDAAPALARLEVIERCATRHAMSVALAAFDADQLAAKRAQSSAEYEQRRAEIYAFRQGGDPPSNWTPGDEEFALRAPSTIFGALRRGAKAVAGAIGGG
jgi:hypothetical protein